MRIAGFEEEKLTGEAELGDGEIRARVSGTASQREVVTLETFFGTIVREAVAAATAAGAAAAAKKVTIALDLRDLRYMNSSHFKLLVSMVAKLKKSGAAVELRLLANEAFHWQKRSLPALKHLAEELVTIE